MDYNKEKLIKTTGKERELIKKKFDEWYKKNKLEGGYKYAEKKKKN